MKVVIGGGTGFVGKRLQALLTSRGHDVTIISRKHAPKTLTWNDVRRNGLPKDSDAVVNLAGKSLMDLERWSEKFREELRSSRIGTTRLLAQAISQADRPPNVFVSTSAVGFYRPSLTAEYTEESPGGDFDFLSRLCHDWEEAAKLPSDIKTRSVIVRVGLVLGRDGGPIRSMYLPFYLGLGGRVASGKQWFPWIHVDDAAGIFAHALETDLGSGILNATSPNPVTNAEFSKALGKAMGRPTCFPTPEFVLKAVFGSERAKVMAEGQKVLPKRTLETGYHFLYTDVLEACHQAIK